jgi:hypothetical protein
MCSYFVLERAPFKGGDAQNSGRRCALEIGLRRALRRKGVGRMLEATDRDPRHLRPLLFSQGGLPHLLLLVQRREVFSNHLSSGVLRTKHSFLNQQRALQE